MLTTEIIRRVKEIQIRTGRSVADVLAGEYASVFRGSGIEFDEVRPYVPGDDVRSIDWNVTARAGEPFVKRYVEERELSLMLMADISASQDFGSGQRSKREVTAELCALLAFTATRSNDKVGLALFHGEIEKFIPPRKGQKHALRVVREILAQGSGDESATIAAKQRWNWRRLFSRAGRGIRTQRESTNVAGAMQFLLSISKRKSLCFVVSDFIDDNFETALSMANRRHDVVAVLVSDPHELALPDIGLVALSDAESGEARLVDTASKAFQEQFLAENAQRVWTLETRLRRRGIDFIHVQTHESVVEPLLAFFKMRERRVRR